MASDRLAALKAFDETKAGVKGLVDAGVKAVPDIFRHPPDPLPQCTKGQGSDRVRPGGGGRGWPAALQDRHGGGAAPLVREAERAP
ncbi:hypothetical protein TRIUR3_18433 [Triticum urartu]|uniref:Uncharacterized protein n=1 Tax=Triticum urartu TaxID=4572 RepID=M7Z4L8_TRIUA|nr:hypothetical protein TRIUR3_18433 [Triticum urartu]